MIKMIQTDVDQLNKYMFSSVNMKRGYKVPPVAQIIPAEKLLPVKEEVPEQVPQPELSKVPEQVQEIAIVQKPAINHFIPTQKDKLFWCFYIILKGYDEYEMNRSTSFTVEKQLKIETVEKLKLIKEKLKELKLKRTELEDELVNKPTISLKGLYALCLVHNVSITYIYGRKYCEFFAMSPDTARKGTIVQNAKKEDMIKWIMPVNVNAVNIEDEYLTTIRNEYWFIENIQKPLNAPSAYDLKELCDICEKLQIETHVKVSESKTKAKTKKQLYEEILEQL
jgi:hypothetical protein